MPRHLLVVLLLLALQACSVLTSPKAKPVIEDRVSEHSRRTVGILATTPERRVVLVKMPDHKFCAEPPPDAADQVSSALSAVAQASAKAEVSDAQLGFAQTLATSVKQLFVRTQGVQLYRDGTFMLCTAYLNGAIDGHELVARQQALLEAVLPLITAEIPELHRAQVDKTAPPAEPKGANLSVTTGRSE